VGNRLSRSNVTSGTTTLTTYAYEASGSDRLMSEATSINSGTAVTTAYAYDGNGNQTTVKGLAARYDFENHLVELGPIGTLSAAYTYDGDGIRHSGAVSSSSSSTYVVDSSLPY